MKFFSHIKINNLIFWKVILWVILLYAVQHTFRDILQDIFGIHNAFTEFGHRETSVATWCGQYCKWTTFPVEIFYIISSICLLRKPKISWLVLIMIIVIIPVLLQYSDFIIK